MEPPPELDIPDEIALDICKHLDEKSLWALRLVNRQWSRVTVTALRPFMSDRFHDVQVVVTEDGLRTLGGILSIPEWQALIRSVHFIGHGLSDIHRIQGDDTDPRLLNRKGISVISTMTSSGDSTDFRWFGYFKIPSPCLDKFRDEVEPRQRLFEESSEALELWNTIIQLLKGAPMLQSIRIGFEYQYTRHVIGLRQMLQTMGLPPSSVYVLTHRLAPYLAMGSVSELLLHKQTHFFKAIRESNFDKHIVHYQVKSSDNRDHGLMLNSNWPFSKLWEAMCTDSSKKIELNDQYHECSATEDEEMEERLTYMIPVSALVVNGCGCQNTFCAISDQNLRCMSTTFFPNLSKIELGSLTLGHGNDLVALLHHVSGLKSFSLDGIHLRCGSFISTFTHLLQAPELRDLRIMRLTETEDHWRQPWLTPPPGRFVLRISGNPEVRIFLDHVIASYRTVRKLTLIGHSYNSPDTYQNWVLLPDVDFKNPDMNLDW